MSKLQYFCPQTWRSWSDGGVECIIKRQGRFPVVRTSRCAQAYTLPWSCFSSLPLGQLQAERAPQLRTRSTLSIASVKRIAPYTGKLNLSALNAATILCTCIDTNVSDAKLYKLNRACRIQTTKCMFLESCFDDVYDCICIEVRCAINWRKHKRWI